ncbi:MAG TPA: bifunctional YncE family protein/alkaline phosphatase family protein [Rhizomicrobium sp.]|nr:bifunctional YncE family protein/alkaline phosphatase family protein [Rhizomicrobium sp.]
MKTTTFLALLASALLISPWSVRAADDPNRTVGPQNDGSIVASSNQTLTPAGTIVELGSPVRAKAVALNPKTGTAAVLLMGAAEPVIIFNTATGQVLQRFIPTVVKDGAFSSNKAGSFTGITYSPDGSHLLFSQDDNHVVIATIHPQTGLIQGSQSILLPPPPADGRPYFNATAINPGGIAISGNRAYVVLNAANSLGVIDLSTARLIAQIPVGNAPNSIVIAGNRAYVSNEGGRPATPKDFTNISDGTPIVVDRQDAFAITGTVSVIDLAAAREVATIPVGLHPAGMALSGSSLYVTNAYGDSLSVIDLNSGKVTRTIPVGVPVAKGAFGSGPNAVAVTASGQAYVSLGQANAIAVVDLAGRDANPVVGYIPTAYFPTSIAYDAARRQLVVADDKGLGAQGSIGSAQGVSAFNTHQDSGAVNLIPLPAAEQLARYTQQVIANNHWNLTANIEVGREFIDSKARPVAVPKHIGEPSLIRHVFLIIKENRTYDQMLGDVAFGNGDPSLAIFASATPNQHALVQRFPLLDNIYAPSRQSADGHPWIVSSGSFYSNDILSPDWIRSYTGGNSDDPLTYTPKGFLWSAAAAKGLTVKLYGEWADDNPKLTKKPDGTDYNWSDFYATAQCKEKLAPASSCIVPDNAVTQTSSVPSAARILDPHYPAFNLTIPDQYRVDYWLPLFQQQVAAGQVPSLTILWLPSDHTNGTAKGFPYPRNYQADNDLALGRIVEAISHSKVWGQSAIFVEEDDAQNGVDHVDGHRQPVYVISPYATAPQAPGQGKVIHTTYTAENINRTIENILGMQPLTQFDLVASPMFDVFQDTPDLTPFTHLPAPFPLDQGPGLSDTKSDTKTGAVDPLQKAWLAATWEVMKDKLTKADAADPDFLNHVTWYSATDWKRPYPGEKKLQMPGPFVRAAKRYRDKDDD